MLAGQREGVRNPAVGIDHMAGNSAVVDAGNGITWKRTITISFGGLQWRIDGVAYQLDCWLSRARSIGRAQRWLTGNDTGTPYYR